MMSEGIPSRRAGAAHIEARARLHLLQYCMTDVLRYRIKNLVNEIINYRVFEGYH